MKIRELIDHLNTYDPEQEVAYDLWTIEDVECQLDERNEVMTEAEMIEVIELVEGTKDATLGINWTTIDCAIDEVIDLRK